MTKMKNDIGKAVKGLIDSGAADKEPKDLFIPQLVMEDIFDQYKDKFDDYVIDAIDAVKTTTLLHQYDEPVKMELHDLIELMKRLDLNQDISDKSTANHGFIFQEHAFDALDKTCGLQRKIAPVKYLGCRVYDKRDLDSGVDRVYKHIKEYVDAGYIMGHLQKLLYIPFAGQEYGSTGGAVLSYLIFTEEGAEYLENNKPDVHVQEGGVPKSLED